MIPARFLFPADSFEAWQHRPVYVAMCITAHVARELAGLELARGQAVALRVDMSDPAGPAAAHPLYGLRMLPPYRTPAVLAFRRRVAERVRALRKARALPGMLRGPHRGAEGSPRPWQAHTRAANGWVTLHGQTPAEACRLARLFVWHALGIK